MNIQDPAKKLLKFTCEKCEEHSVSAGDQPSSGEEGAVNIAPRSRRTVTDQHDFRTYVAGINKKLDELQPIKEALDTNNKALDNNSQEVKKLKNSIATIEEAMNFCSNKIDEFVKTTANLSKENALLQKEVHKLQKKSKEADDKLEFMEAKLEELEQKLKLSEIEICGVPVTRNENLQTIVCNVAKLIDIELDTKTIQDIYRPPKTTGARPIIIKLNTVNARNTWLERAKVKRGIKAKDVYTGFPETAVYINEALTPAKKRLLYLAKMFAREKRYKYVWIKDGNVLMRKDEGEKTIQVKHHIDLENLAQPIENTAE
ncbi:uncharacterized protein LOC124405931 [Diprion similis]|uniref:uncharacterized protein LOC124405931 n=1 Tax=Diprion similis TaxID=362088 RepID=UPI001EF8ED54|nr:uncharacterized protein LOC124405931 [Diprion similis]